MTASVASIYRHPVKGLTPELLARVQLTAGEYFPADRAYAIEVGPSGFDPEKPAHIPKQRFTVLARFPALARIKTRLDDASGVFQIGDAHGFGVDTRLDTAEGRSALERFLQAYLGEDANGKLRVLEGPGRHRFMDHPQGYVSLINLASVRAMAHALGREIDPLRFRANIYVDGLQAWAEDDWTVEGRVTAGEAELAVFKPIVRCVATDVDLETGERDIDMVAMLRAHFARDTLGTYFSVVRGGVVMPGDSIIA